MIEVRNLTKTLTSGTQKLEILRGIDLTVGPTFLPILRTSNIPLHPSHNKNHAALARMAALPGLSFSGVH